MHLPWRPIPLNGGPPIDTSLTAQETSTLQQLATDRDVVTIGTAFAFADIAMAQTARKVATIDPHCFIPDSFSIAQRNIEDYHLGDRIWTIVGMSGYVMPVLAGLYNFAFIDGDHTNPGVQTDISLVMRGIRRPGIIAVHDVGECCCPEVEPTALDLLGPPDQKVDTLGIWKV